MFLEYMFMRIGIDIVKIDKTKAQQVKQTLTGAKRSQNRVRGSVILLIGLIFWRRLDDTVVRIFQDVILHIVLQLSVWEVTDEVIVFLSEDIEDYLLFCTTAIEGSLKRHLRREVIMLVIAEDHQLCQVQETTELGIRETSIVHAMVFLEHAAMIIRHLHFNEYQW